MSNTNKKNTTTNITKVLNKSEICKKRLINVNIYFIAQCQIHNVKSTYITININHKNLIVRKTIRTMIKNEINYSNFNKICTLLIYKLKLELSTLNNQTRFEVIMFIMQMEIILI